MNRSDDDDNPIQSDGPVTPDPADATLEERVGRARLGDEQSVSAVIQHIQPVLRRFFVGRIGRGSDVDDLVQNTLVRLLRGLPDLKDVSKLRPFAMKAALFELQDLYRGRYGTRELRMDPGTLESASVSTNPALGIDLERALASLTPRARQILELKAMGYRYEEIARMIESTEAAVKMQVKRALDRLRDILGSLAWTMLASVIRAG